MELAEGDVFNVKLILVRPAQKGEPDEAGKPIATDRPLWWCVGEWSGEKTILVPLSDIQRLGRIGRFSGNEKAALTEVLKE